MTVSRIYKLTAGQLIEDALRDSKIIPAEQPVSDYDYQNGLDSLNKVSKRIQTKGLHQWLMERAVLPIVPGKMVYSLGPDGDPCGYSDSFVETQTQNSSIAASDTVILKDILGIFPPPELLNHSIVASTQGWEPINGATISEIAGIEIKNVGATQGGAKYTLETEIGKKYRLQFGYVQGISAAAVFSVKNGGVSAATVSMAADGFSELIFTATLTSVTFEFSNASPAAGATSYLIYAQLYDYYGGSRIGILENDGLMQWSYVLEVNSTTHAVRITEPLISDVNSSATVYSFSKQIDRPLQLFNATFSNSYLRNEIPISRWARQEYMQQPMKGAKGIVVNWYYNPTLDDGKLYVWNTGQNPVNTVQFDVRKATAVYSEISDPLDFPDEYLLPLKWLIAADIGPSYGVPESRQAVLEGKAAAFFEEALDNDNELDSILVQPDWIR